MFNFSLLTGPLFFAGVLNGLNKRAEPNFQHDPRAHYKIMGIGMGLTTAHAVSQYFKEHHPNMKSSFSSHVVSGGLVGGALAVGSVYCMGLMLTKVPSKKAFE